MTTPPLRLLTGHTVHARLVPFEQRFRYRLLMVDVDIDRLEEASRRTALFSVDKANLYGLRRTEHGGRGRNHLRGWAQARLNEADVDLDGGVIRLVTFPRHLFYRFAPLSVWFGHGPGGELRGVIYEVNNTFGETHTYVAPVRPGTRKSLADKRFHVSPFFDVTGRYRFTLDRSEDALSLVIDTLVDGERTHMATISARARPATTAGFARAALTHPLSAIGVSAGIHFEALKLWLRGARYRSKPAPPDQGTTVARPLSD